nr:class I SAM-dependent methyltransferase [Desulfobulbaceae bacterium]
MITDPLNILVLDETGRNTSQVTLLNEQISRSGIELCLGQSEFGPQTYTLVYTAERVELRPPEASLGQPFAVDFGSGSVSYRLKNGSVKKEDIARAVGLKKGTPHIIDATCGFAQDSFILAALGCTISLCERSPITHALVSDALKRAASSPQLAPIIQRITLHLGDSLDLIPQLSASHPADVIYLDPMYPHRTKSALVKKQMRLLRQLVGKDADANQLHHRALEYAHSRVVCKRPITADFLSDMKPDFAIKGKKHRFDVYLCTSNR